MGLQRKQGITVDAFETGSWKDLLFQDPSAFLCIAWVAGVLGCCIRQESGGWLAGWPFQWGRGITGICISGIEERMQIWAVWGSRLCHS